MIKYVLLLAVSCSLYPVQRSAQKRAAHIASHLKQLPQQNKQITSLPAPAPVPAQKKEFRALRSNG